MTITGKDETTGARWLRGWFVLVSAIVAVVIVGGAGFAIARLSGGAAGPASRSTSATVATQAHGNTQASGAAAAYTACTTQTQPTFSALADLNSRLTVGLNAGSYTTRVGTVKVVSDQLAAAPVETGCAAVVSQLNQAVDQYIAASTAWSSCIQAGSCGDPGADNQLYWGNADARVQAARTDLAAMGGPSLSSKRVHDALQLVAAQDLSAQQVAHAAQSIADETDFIQGKVAGVASITKQDAAINSAINGNAHLSTARSIGQSRSNRYTVTATSASGHTFTLTKQPNGHLAHTCMGDGSPSCVGGGW